MVGGLIDGMGQKKMAHSTRAKIERGQNAGGIVHRRGLQAPHSPRGTALAPRSPWHGRGWGFGLLALGCAFALGAVAGCKRPQSATSQTSSTQTSRTQTSRTQTSRAQTSRAAAAKGAANAKGQGSTAPAPDPRSRLPMIDSHIHLTPLDGPFNTALRLFGELGITKFAVKSAGEPGSPRYQATLRYANYLGERMAFFTTLDWEGIDDPKWAQREADKIAMAMRDGASGIKIFKNLGLGVRLADGSLLKVDDPRLDPIFKRCGELGAIVAWHVADPVAFFKAITPDNERYAELSLAPSWSFYGKDFPSHGALLAARDRVLARHPKTTFLGIHLANYPENLDYVASVLERFPNFYVDTAARIPEIGRHPVAKLKAFFTKYQDRILFGSDMIITPMGYQLGSVSEQPPGYPEALAFYRAHRRFFESADRNFPHPTPIQGKWTINGIDLPLAVLRKLYTENAERLIFRRRSAFVAAQRQRSTKPSS